LSATTTIKAIATAANMSSSSIASATYTVQAATPTFSPAPGSYTTAQSVSILDTTPNATILLHAERHASHHVLPGV
jgi:hypothetical protein